MALTRKTTESNLDWKKYIIPTYIVVSALLLLIVLYWYIVNSIYGAGYNTWAQNWYQSAVSELITEVTKECKGIKVSLWDSEVEVVNVACLQNNQAAQANQEQLPANQSNIPE